MSICIDSYKDGNKKVYFVKVDGREVSTCGSLGECFKVIQSLMRKEK